MYRILRDNKEQGPISQEELLALHLKPYDLIWVEGKSAGWRYPSEIALLQPFLDASVFPQKEKHTAVVMPKSFQAHPASQNTRSNDIPIISSSPLVFNEEQHEVELTAEHLEKKSAEIFERVQAFSRQKEQNQQATQTNYARSLEDLKQEYADWLHKKKEKKNFRLIKPGKPGLIAASLVGVMALVFAFYFSTGEKKMENGLKPGEKYISNAASQPIPLPVKMEEPPIRTSNMSTIPTTKVSSTKELNVDQFIDSVRKALARGSSRKSIKKMTPSDYTEETIAHNTLPLPTQTEPEEVKKEITAGQKVNMNARYEQDAHKKSISSLEVTIQNNSTALIKTVSVDIFYYKRGDRLFDKETIYFNNIQPGNSLTVSRPGNRKAATARFQMGQISSL